MFKSPREKLNDFVEIVKPIQKWLVENGYPTSMITIHPDKAVMYDSMYMSAYKKEVE